MAEPLAISDAEWRIMNVVWDDQPIEAQAIIDRLAEPNDWSAATVKTMLHRLAKKGALAFDREGRRYVYRAAVKRSVCVRQESRGFLDRVFGGDAAPALMHLVKNAKLSDDDVAELRRLLDSKPRQTKEGKR